MSEVTVLMGCVDPRNAMQSAKQHVADRFGVLTRTITSGPADAGIVKDLCVHNRLCERHIETVCELEKRGKKVVRIVVMAHESCIGNPLTRQNQCAQLEAATDLLARQFRGVEVFGLYLELTADSDDDHEVSPHYGWAADWQDIHPEV